MAVRMEQKHRITKSKHEESGKKRRKKIGQGGGDASDRCAGSSIPIVSRPRTKIRGWTFDWWTDYISDRICIDYRGGRELPTILDVSIATVRRVCTRSNADKIRRVNAIVFRKIDRDCCRFLCNLISIFWMFEYFFEIYIKNGRRGEKTKFKVIYAYKITHCCLRCLKGSGLYLS